MLPENIKSIDLNLCVIEFRPDGKILFISKDKVNPFHITISLGNKSGIIDIHKTWRDKNGAEQHDTLFAIPEKTLSIILKAFCEQAGQFLMQDIMSFYKPCRLGWLKHRNIGVITGIFPTETDLPKITRKKGSRLKLDMELIEQNAVVPEYLEDIYDFPDGTIFALMKRRKKKWSMTGLLIKITDRSGLPRLFRSKFGDEIKLRNIYEPMIIPLLKKHSLSPAEIISFRQNIDAYAANKN